MGGFDRSRKKDASSRPRAMLGKHGDEKGHAVAEPAPAQAAENAAGSGGNPAAAAQLFDGLYGDEHREGEHGSTVAPQIGGATVKGVSEMELGLAIKREHGFGE